MTNINQNEGSHYSIRGGLLHKIITTMAKTKKMTLKYWNSLSAGSKKRALQYCFPIHPAIVEMLMNEKTDLKSDWWQMVFKKVRIPAPGSYYKTVVNNTYLN